MFMFRRKRPNLIKRLLKARIRGANDQSTRHETSGETEDLFGPSGATWGTSGSSSECETILRTTLLKKLEDAQLELLCGAVESKGEELSDCVLIPRVFKNYSSASKPAVGGVAVHVLCCQMWRWPDVRHADELKRLPVCGSHKDPVYMCCNPYHWSRLCEPESPPPPYSRFAMEQLKPEDRAPSEIPFLCGDRFVGSVTTSGEGNNFNSSSFPNNTGEWCRLAYWELTQRVGNQFPVRVPAISVFENEPRGNGLCLATLQNGIPAPPECVRRTRAKIGHGVILSQESDGVWAYNISNQPIFVNSPTLTADMLYNIANNNANNPNSHMPTTNAALCVYRIPPGHCLCIHDPYRITSNWYQHLEVQMPRTGPVDPNSIRISFVKGWGPNYSRQEITACHCWLEVLLAPCR